MKLEDSDIAKLIKNNGYRFLNDLQNEKVGIQYRYAAVFFPDSLDHFIHENSNNEGILWIDKKDISPLLLVEIEKIGMGDEGEKRYLVRPREVN